MISLVEQNLYDSLRSFCNGNRWVLIWGVDKVICSGHYRRRNHIEPCNKELLDGELVYYDVDGHCMMKEGVHGRQVTEDRAIFCVDCAKGNPDRGPFMNYQIKPRYKTRNNIREYQERGELKILSTKREAEEFKYEKDNKNKAVDEILKRYY